MLKVKKWDFTKHIYEDVEIPEGCSLYESDMDKTVICPGCGQRFRCGDGYTSKRYHTEHGFGYSVCAKCYEKEVKEYFENDQTRT